MEKLECDFIEHMKEKKLSENSIDAYSRDISRFTEFAKSRNEDVTEVDIVTIMSFSQMLKKTKKAN